MRECIYCGRQLEKGEVCTCAMSLKKRREREENAAAAEPEPEARETAREDKTAKKEEKRREKEEKKRAKQQARRTAGGRTKGKNALLGAWRLVMDFLRSPIETIMNPSDMGMAETLILVVVEGMIGGLCAYSIITGASRGPFSFLGNILGFKGISGYSVLLGWFMSALSGALSGTLIFFIYSGIFYLINKWVFRCFSPYREFIKRFAFVAMPMAAVGIAGIVLGMFSQRTFGLLLVVGAVGTVILTYELLRSMWYSKSASKTMLVMMLAIFVFMLIVSNIVRFSV
ncbi:MAG: hypothetical protein IJH37_08215 [Clostridia bacterium]|nr:hypothetical protein [Clostridia bacterium]